MIKILSLFVLAVSAATLAGCASTASPSPGGSAGTAGSSGPSTSSGTSGSVVSAADECATAKTALAKFVTGAMSAPYQKGDTCFFGVGPNGAATGSALAGLYGDVVHVQLTTSDAASQYQAATVAYSGSKPLSGVGTQAQYYDGGNGNPQVSARTDSAFCLVQTYFNAASEVGLTKPTDARTIAAADVPKLAAEIGSVCTALFGG